MSNKVIAIRQADGSYYPIMKEGEAGTKSLQLTTVRDNQTTVKVNLYKLTEGSDEDPKYMDTLLIENLNNHLQGEASLNLDLSIDDNDIVSAQIIDPETGAASNTEVSFVTLAEQNIDTVSDFTIDSEEPPENDDFNISDLEDLPDFDETDTETDIPEFDVNTDIETDAPDDISSEELEAPEDDNFDTSDMEDFPDFEDTELPDFEETSPDEIPVEDSEIPEEGTDTTNAIKPATEPELSDFNEDITEPEEADFDTSDLDDLPGFDDIETPIFDDNKSQIKTDNLYQETQPFTKNENELPPLYDETLSDDVEKIETKERRQFRIPLIICFICTLLCIAAVILIFIFSPFPSSNNTNLVPPVAENIVTTEAPIEKVTIVPEEKIDQISEKEIIAENTIEIVPEETIPEPIAPVEKTTTNNVTYLLRWGDTLWDLSETYYRTPWLFTKIAEYNNIKNPDMIIAGTNIEIPAR